MFFFVFLSSFSQRGKGEGGKGEGGKGEGRREKGGGKETRNEKK